MVSPKRSRASSGTYPMDRTSDQDSENVSSNFEDKHDAKMLIIKKEKKHKCTYLDCHAVFSKPSRLERHMRQHTGERPYTCNKPGCTKSYASSCHLKRHLKTHDLIETVYKCPQCSQMVVNFYSLKRHYKEQHGKDKTFCRECGQMFNKKYELAKHSNTVHFKSTMYTCDKCAKSFANISRLKRHKKNHEKSYPCPVSGCLEIFSKWSLLRKHKKEHVTEYKCDKCNKILRTRRQLKAHSKIHSEVRMVMLCPYDKCHKVYYYKFNLEQHIKIKHLGEKFYCDICSIGITSKQKLIEHIERHTTSDIKQHKLKENNPNKIQRKKRKDIGIPKKSIIGKLIGCNFPHNIEKQLLKRETTIKVSSDMSSNNI